MIDNVSSDFLQSSVHDRNLHTSPWRKILISPTNKNEGMVLKKEAIEKIYLKKEEIRRKIKTKKKKQHTVLFYNYYDLTCNTKHTPSLLAVCACVWDFSSSSGSVLRMSYAS